jgi:serine/threonine protein kinase/Tol biopolymer transport system component
MNEQRADDSRESIKPPQRLSSSERAEETIQLASPTLSGRHVFTPGQVVAGRFRIVRLLGQGGMGEVYEAIDLELGESVALKTIRSEIAADGHTVSRFRKEIQLARKVTHANVCRVFDIERHSSPEGDIVILSMELLRGETLANRLRRLGAMSVDDAGPLVLQMIHGLTAAHRAGVIHRDFKPGNVYLERDSEGGTRVVITDFGLAWNAAGIDTGTLTETGQIVGTLAYMAPEQLRGQEVTFATDVYALGIVMFEMVTGRRPFQGDGIASAVRRLTEPSPSPVQFAPTLDPRWLTAIVRCLEVDPALRFTSAGEVGECLSGGRTQTPEHGATPLPTLLPPSGGGTAPVIVGAWQSRHNRLILVAVLIAALGVAGSVWWSLANRHDRRSTIIDQAAVTQLSFDEGFTSDATFSADGKFMGFASNRGPEGSIDIWVSYGGGSPSRITNNKANQSESALSPDGGQIAYRSEREGGGIYINDAVGGGNERLLAKFGRWPHFSPDGKYVAYWTGEEGHFVLLTGKIYVLTAAGGGIARQLRPEFADARYPIWSDDGRHILFQGIRDPGGSPDATADWWVTSLDGSELVKTGAFERFRKLDLRPHFSPPAWRKNEVIFAAAKAHSTNLWRIEIPPASGQAKGDPQRLTNGAGMETTPWVLADGRVAYTSKVAVINVWGIPLSPKTGGQAGKPKQLTSGIVLNTRPTVSADGKKLAFARRVADVRNVWIRDLETGKETSLTSSEEADPVVSPDGRSIAYSLWEQRKQPIYIIASEGGSPRKVCEDCGEVLSWAPEGSKILYLAGHPASVYSFEVATGQRLLWLKDTSHDLDQAQISPDGKWLTFVVRLSADQSEILLGPLRQGSSTSDSGWIRLTDNRAWNDKPRWSPDGRSIYFYSNRDGVACIWQQRVDASTMRPAGAPAPLVHFHDTNFSLAPISRGAFGLSVARDMLVLNVGSQKANIWVTQLPE